MKKYQKTEGVRSVDRSEAGVNEILSNNLFHNHFKICLCTDKHFDLLVLCNVQMTLFKTEKKVFINELDRTIK